MLTLIHSPQSRSTRVLWALEESGLPYDVRYVTIGRQDGSGGPDPNNPHPAKKVPALIHDGQVILETSGIILHIAQMAPQSPLMPRPGTPESGAALSWVATYAATLEPALIATFAGVGDNPVLQRGLGTAATVRGMLLDALATGPYLTGDQFTAADLMFTDMAAWMRDALPPGDLVDAYIQRCITRPARERALAKDAAPA